MRDSGGRVAVILAAVALASVTFLIGTMGYQFFCGRTQGHRRASGTEEPARVRSMTGASSTDPEQDVIQAKLRRMTLDQQLGQMVMFGFGGTDGVQGVRFIRKCHAGGLILFRANMASNDQTRRMTALLQRESRSRNGVGLLIATDQEGGKVVTLRPEMCPRGLSNQELGESRDISAVEEQAAETATVLRQLGINTDLAPVIDVKTETRNTVIGERSYGADPDVVAELGCACARTLQQNGIIAVVKHFPGHGPTRTDSHRSLPVVDISRAEAETTHLLPFKRAIDDGAEVVMTGHVVYRELDSYPATLSSKLVNGYLRGGLGFRGVVITDSLGMGAIRDNYKWADVVARSVNAGADILLVAHDESLMRQTYSALRGAVDKGAISRERIAQSVERILRLKLEHGLLDQGSPMTAQVRRRSSTQ